MPTLTYDDKAFSAGRVNLWLSRDSLATAYSFYRVGNGGRRVLVRKWSLPQTNDGPLWADAPQRFIGSITYADGSEVFSNEILVSIPERVAQPGGPVVGVYVRFPGEDRLSTGEPPYDPVKAANTLSAVGNYVFVESGGRTAFTAVSTYNVLMPYPRTTYQPSGGVMNWTMLTADIKAQLSQVAWAGVFRLVLDVWKLNGLDGMGVVTGYLNGSDMTGNVIIHEFGHSVGMAHSEVTKSVADPQHITSYARDQYDPMGSTYAPGTHFSALSRWQAGWFPPSDRLILAPGSNFNLTLSRLEGASAPRAVLIPVDEFGSAWVFEYRQDRRFGPPYDQVLGVQLRFRPGFTIGGAPGPSSMLVANNATVPWLPNGVWTDPTRPNISVTIGTNTGIPLLVR